MTESPLVIIGMARSGTSLLGKMVEHLGIAFGPKESLIPGDRDNPDGYQELAAVGDLNDRIKFSLGMFANPGLHMPQDWADYEGVIALRDQLRSILNETFGSEKNWAIKDPRISLMLPIYKDMYPSARFAICARNPIDCADSFSRKFEVPHSIALGMWIQHTLCSLYETIDCDRRVVLFEDLFDDPTLPLHQVIEMSGDRSPTVKDFRRARGVVRQERNHGSGDYEAARHLAPALIGRTFDLCQHAANDPGALQKGIFDTKISELWLEYEAWMTINPSNLVLSTLFQIWWQIDGQEMTTSRQYLPVAKPQTLSLEVNIPADTPVSCSFSHLPGLFVMRGISATNARGGTRSVPVKPIPDINVTGDQTCSTWWVPRDGRHFTFDTPEEIRRLNITFSSSIYPIDMARVASRSYRDLVKSKVSVSKLSKRM